MDALPAILLVDNEDLLRRAMLRLLQTETYDLMGVASAQEALDTAAELGVRLKVLLVDWNLNGSARGLVEEAHRKYPWVRIMILTGAPELVGEVDDVDRILEKPFDTSLLIKLLRALVSVNPD